MSAKEFKDIIKGKQDFLEEKLDVEHGLLSKLEACGVITGPHRNTINVRITCYYW